MHKSKLVDAWYLGTRSVMLGTCTGASSNQDVYMVSTLFGSINFHMEVTPFYTPFSHPIMHNASALFTYVNG